jgi:membrane protein required for colicin V production
VNIVDLILIVLLSLFALRGYFKGFFRESFSLMGFLLGLIAAVRYDEAVALLWANHWDISPLILKALSFVGLFFVVYFAFSLAGWLLHRSSQYLFLGGFNRVGGIVLGIGKGTVILALAVFFLSSFPWMPQGAKQTVEDSYLAFPLYRVGQGLIRIGMAHLPPQEKSKTLDGRAVRLF